MRIRNEYDAPLDRNNYAPSIITHLDRCYICGKTTNLQRHEIFNAAFREKSKRLGLWIPLCSMCHWDITHVHALKRIELKTVGQKAAMEHYGLSVDEFIRMFGKSYI